MLVPVQEVGTVSFTHKKTGEQMTTEVERSTWEAQAAPWFDWDEQGFLEGIV